MDSTFFENLEKQIISESISLNNESYANSIWLLLKRDVEMSLAIADSREKELKRQIIRFESKFDKDANKWFFEDRHGHLLDNLKNGWKIKNLPDSMSRWFSIDVAMDNAKQAIQAEFFNDLKMIKWLDSQLISPSVLQTKTAPSVLTNELSRIDKQVLSELKIKLNEVPKRPKGEVFAEISAKYGKGYGKSTLHNLLKINSL